MIMSKKDLRNVTADLAGLAESLPTQRIAPSKPRTAKPSTPSVLSGAGEEVIQFSLSLRKNLRKELARMADDADMTMRAYVLNALKEKGLSVRADDLADLRKRRG
jgi:hypothetical protein